MVVTNIVGTGSKFAFENATADPTSIGGYVAIGEQHDMMRVTAVRSKYFIGKV
jgi:hypothetical protein